MSLLLPAACLSHKMDACGSLQSAYETKHSLLARAGFSQTRDVCKPLLLHAGSLQVDVSKSRF